MRTTDPVAMWFLVTHQATSDLICNKILASKMDPEQQSRPLTSLQCMCTGSLCADYSVQIPRQLMRLWTSVQDGSTCVCERLALVLRKAKSLCTVAKSATFHAHSASGLQWPCARADARGRIDSPAARNEADF